MWSDEMNVSTDDDDDEQVKVTFFKKEKSFLLCLIKNQQHSLPIKILNFIIQILPCILYIIQVFRDDPLSINGCCHICQNHTSTNHGVDETDITNVHWNRIGFVNRTFELWITQIISACLSILQFVLRIYLCRKSRLVSFSLMVDALLELVSSVPFIISVFHQNVLRCIFIPSFLTCWMAKKQFEEIFRNQSRIPTLLHIVLKVIGSTLCIIFTSVCGFQHIQRGGYRHVTFFESLWFVVVTFSTIGYGDYKPDIWLSQAFMIVMIVVGLIVIPIELERLVNVWLEKCKLGGTYSQYRSKREKHVVLCTTSLKPDVIMGFLNEFFAHQILQGHFVCLLSPCEMDSTTKIILQMPKWSQRILYIQGSALKEVDLARCKMQDAAVCFILTPDGYTDFEMADRHTIMRSWAIKDFAPNCQQCVQLYRPENKMHVNFADHVVCMDEFKYALLGNNARLPGVSTLITLLINTTRGKEGQTSADQVQKLYGHCSGNEIYNIKLADSKFFKEYQGCTFSTACYSVYKKYGICLIAILSTEKNVIQLNPGSKHIMQQHDTCFYLSMTPEENSSVSKSNRNIKTPHNNNNQSVTLITQGTASPHFNWPNEMQLKCVYQPFTTEDINSTIECPRTISNFGTSQCFCHILRDKRPLCCLKLAIPCDHNFFNNVKDYRFGDKTIIVCCETAHYGLHNFIVPLRNHWIPLVELRPIIIMVKKKPSVNFLESIRYFPSIYWMIGSSDSINDLLKAGIIDTQTVVIISKESRNSAEEDSFSDSSTILTVQKIYRFFPHVKILTQISHCTNMKYALFSPDDGRITQMSKFERKERSRGSSICYMFRPSFSSGCIFSIDMLNTLLYQSFVKPLLITFLRILLGIDQPAGSGHLSCISISDEELKLRTYGRLYKTLVIKTGIPIGIYRTIRNEKIDVNKSDIENVFAENRTRKELKDLSDSVRNRISALGLPYQPYEPRGVDYNQSSYVIINPNKDVKLQKDDIVYIISAPTQMKMSSTEEYACRSENVIINVLEPSQSSSEISENYSRISSLNRSQNSEFRNENSPLLRYPDGRTNENTV